MTERLYYTDPHTTEFEATVASVRRDGDRAVVVLDRTAFYPTSGGQPHDVGTLADAAVVDVVDLEDDTVGHVVDRDLAVGARVRGRVDWTRRFEHMQQHTGQHVLSAAFDRLHHVATVSFHLGVETATIDLAREVSGGQIETAESEANRVVWEDRPVSVRFVDAEEAATLALRKDPARRGRVRLVDVEDFDLSACGGTHVRRTGAIGIVAVVGSERVRGGTRIEFVCGARALTRWRTTRAIVEAAVRPLSVHPRDLPASIARLQHEHKELQRLLRGRAEQLAAYESEAFVRRGASVGGATLVVEVVDGRDAGSLKQLAMTIVSRPGTVAVLFSGSPALVVVGRSADVSLDAASILRHLTARFGGRGGGKTDFAQGGGLSGDSASWVEEARLLATNALA